jgi:3-oxoacyl-[acyl-carrier-protein] synthase II
MSAERHEVVITGAGVVSPLADSAAALHRALIEGRCGLRPVEAFETGGTSCHRGGELNGFAPERYLEGANLRPLDRTGRLAAAAARLALADAGWSAALCEAEEAGLVLGTMFGSVRTIAEFDRRALTAGPSYVKPFDFANSVINAAAGQAAIWHRLAGVNTTVAGGTTAGLQAIAHAADLVRTGQAPAVLAGGAEELCFESFLGFAKGGRLAADGDGRPAVPFHARRSGFHLGEGAALLALEQAGAAGRRGARVLARVLGSGAAFDPSRGADPARTADAVARAVLAALLDARLTPGDVDCLSASASGGPATDRAEAAGVAAALGRRAATLPVTAVKGQLGEALGASGALQAVVLVTSLLAGELPGIAGLDEVEPGLPLALAGPESRRGSFRRGLATAVGLDGAVSALVLERAAEEGAA